MISMLTDNNNDLYLDGKRNLAFGSDIKAVVQVVQNELNTLLGEIQMDTTLGIPYFETIFNKSSPDISAWEGYMIETAEKVNGVIRVDEMQSSIKDNTLTYTMTIITQYGSAVITG